MQKIALCLFLSFSSIALATEMPLGRYLELLEGDLDHFMIPDYSENACVEGKKDSGFNAKKCIDEICIRPKGIEPEFLTREDMSSLVRCVVQKEDPKNKGICKNLNLRDVQPQMGVIADKLRSFLQLEQRLTGLRVKAATGFIKKPENPNSPFDNFGSNISDIWAFIVENNDLIEVKEGDELRVNIKSHRKTKKRLKKVFNLSRKDQNAVIEVLKALFQDTNSLFALELLGPDYV